MRHRLPIALTLTLTIAFACTACAKSREVIDPAVAAKDPDFLIQGEYFGEGVLGEGEKQKLGAQVVALGNGRFDVKLLAGGLPGAGWSKGDDAIMLKAETDETGKVTLGGHDLTGSIDDGVLSVADKDGNQLIELKQTLRHSPTLGKQAPDKATVLFDGQQAQKYAKEQWHQGHTTDMKTLLSGCRSTYQFSPEGYTLHLEFRTSWMPEARGQGRSNSGVYIHESYECQVLDSFGLEGRNNECGGFYKIKAPAVNMALPPLQWQTYDIDFTPAKYDASGKKVENARVTVRHNGVVIHDDLELPHHTAGGKPERPEPRGVFLQGHGNKVQYRNIWTLPQK